MKGIGVGLLMSLVIVAIFFIAGLLFFGFGNFSVSAFDCEQNTYQQVNKWIQKMSVPGAGEFEDQFKVDGTCMEKITAGGIKFKSQDKQDKPREFKVPEGRNGCSFLGGCPIKFSLPDGKDLLPREAPYDVTIKPFEREIVISK